MHQGQHHRTGPFPPLHPQHVVSQDHVSAPPGTRAPRDVRPAGVVGAGGIRSKPGTPRGETEGGGVQIEHGSRGVSGEGAELDYADGFAAHRGAYEVPGHHASRHTVRGRDVLLPYRLHHR